MNTNSNCKVESLPLSEDQKAFLKMCDEMFKKRYTGEDPDYKKIETIGIDIPPIISLWNINPRKNSNWSDRHRHEQSSQNHYHDRRRHNNRYRDDRSSHKDYRENRNAQSRHHQNRYTPY